MNALRGRRSRDQSLNNPVHKTGSKGSSLGAVRAARLTGEVIFFFFTQGAMP
jgi:hypothetical protein